MIFVTMGAWGGLLKKYVFQPAFWWTQHPKAGRNIQKPTLTNMKNKWRGKWGKKNINNKITKLLKTLAKPAL